MNRWNKLVRGAGMMVSGLTGNSALGARVNAGLAGVGLLADAFKQGQQPVGRLIPVRTIEDRLRIIARNIRAGSRHVPIVRMTRRLVSQRCGDDWCIQPRDERSMIEVIHVAARDLVARWVKDPVGLDWYAHPRYTLDDAAGDCDEKIAAEGAMLGSVGIPCELVAGQEHGAPDYNHVWLHALPEGWDRVPCDPTFDRTIFWRFNGGRSGESAAPSGWELPPESLVRVTTFPVWT